MRNDVENVVCILIHKQNEINIYIDIIKFKKKCI